VLTQHHPPVAPHSCITGQRGTPCSCAITQRSAGARSGAPACTGPRTAARLRAPQAPGLRPAGAPRSAPPQTHTPCPPAGPVSETTRRARAVVYTASCGPPCSMRSMARDRAVAPAHASTRFPRMHLHCDEAVALYFPPLPPFPPRPQSTCTHKHTVKFRAHAATASSDISSSLLRFWCTSGNSSCGHTGHRAACWIPIKQSKGRGKDNCASHEGMHGLFKQRVAGQHCS